MGAFTVADYADHLNTYRQDARNKLESMLRKGLIRTVEPKLVRGKPVACYEFTNGTTIDVRSAASITINIDSRFFSDPFNRTGWRQA